MREKRKINQGWVEYHCKSCIWAVNNELCPFDRCPKVFGWVADKNSSKRKIKGEE